MSAAMEACFTRHVALLSPPLPVPSPPLPFPSPLTTSLTNTGAPLGYRTAGIRMRALLPSTSHRTDIHKADVPPQKRGCLTTVAPRFKVGESSVAGAGRSAAITAHIKTLEAYVAALIAQTSSLQTQLTTALGRIEILEARDLEPQEGPAEAGSSWTFVYLLAIIKISPKKRTTRATPATTTTPTTNVTDAQLQALIDRGVAAALAERTKGVVGLTRWLEKMESVFQINNYTVTCQVKFASFTLQGSALTWWNSHMRVVGQDVPYEAIKFATEMMDKKMLTHAKHQTEHKRKFDDTSRNNQHQQQPFKSNNVARAYTAGLGDKKPYGGTKPLCPKWNYHHDGPCAPKCTNCKKIGHLRAQGENARGITCFECGVQGHYKSDCPKLKNGNQWNRARNGNVVAIVYAVGTARTNQNSNVVTVKHHAVIVYDEKLVHVPFDNKVLIFHGDGSNNGHESRLNIISCTKTQRYLMKGCPIFLAHVTMKGVEDKSKEKRMEDVPLVQDFPKVFPKDLPSIPPSGIPNRFNTCASILALPKGSEDFVVYCDASIKGLGAVLMQREKHAQPEDTHELLRKLLKDFQIISEELAEYINSLSWNHPSFYNDGDEYSIQYKEYLENSSNTIAPVLPTEKPDNSLSMRDEHLSTILETKSDEEIKSSVKDLVSIPSESEGISDDTCDVPFYDNSHFLDVLSDHSDVFSDFNNDCTSSIDVSFEDIDYDEASPLDSKLVSLEEVKNDILCEKLLNINLLIACDLPSSDDFSHVNSFEEKSMTFSIPLFDLNDESLSDEDILEDNVKIYSNPLFDIDDEYIYSNINPLFDEVLKNIESKDFYDSNHDEPDLLVTHFSDADKDECFDSRGDVDEINDFEDDYYDSKGDILYLESLLNDDLVHHDLSIPVMSVVSILEGFTDELPLENNDDLFDLEPKNDEWKKILYYAPFDNLMSKDKVFDPGICVNIFSLTYVSLPFEDHHYIFFTYVVRIFLPNFIYPVVSPFLISSGSEDTIFDPGIFACHFSHRSGTFISFNVYPNILNESPMENCSSTHFTPNITMIWGESS
uniref:Reverse transcriptase domain-containing protein n=1 Tax=Tanacetum cinerariifolium TaxID=118510 RepID=A0A6L2MUC6_TANCI|nr:reverse transcriptase domain-containing protein [Tanacetum cinerariifolium]